MKEKIPIKYIVIKDEKGKLNEKVFFSKPGYYKTLKKVKENHLHDYGGFDTKGKKKSSKPKEKPEKPIIEDKPPKPVGEKKLVRSNYNVRTGKYSARIYFVPVWGSGGKKFHQSVTEPDGSVSLKGVDILSYDKDGVYHSKDGRKFDSYGFEII